MSRKKVQPTPDRPCPSFIVATGDERVFVRHESFTRPGREAPGPTDYTSTTTTEEPVSHRVYCTKPENHEPEHEGLTTIDGSPHEVRW